MDNKTIKLYAKDNTGTLVKLGIDASTLDLSDYVTLDTNQSIDGSKTFNSSIIVNNSIHSLDSSKSIAMFNGTTASHGAGIWLYGNDHASSGTARIQVYNSTSNKYYQLNAYTNGILNWNGTTISTTSVVASNVVAGNKISITGASLNIPADVTSNQSKYLKGDGTWDTPTNTTYGSATTTSNGLMTTTMVTKLNSIESSANNYVHPTNSSYTAGIYKITTDNGHVTTAVAVTAANVSSILGTSAVASATNATKAASCTGNAATATSATSAGTAAALQGRMTVIKGTPPTAATYFTIPVLESGTGTAAKNRLGMYETCVQASSGTVYTQIAAYNNTADNTGFGYIRVYNSAGTVWTDTNGTPAVTDSSNKLATTAFVRNIQPIGSATYVKQATSGNAVVNLNHTAFGALFNAPTKNYRVALATWPGTDDNVKLYSVTNDNITSGTNIVAKQINWNASTGNLSVDSINGFTISKSVPANAVFTDTHNSAFNYLGTSGATANATTATTNTTTYLTLVDGGTLRSNLQIKGAGATTVVANNGVLTISSVNSTYTIPGVFTGATSTTNGTSGLVLAPTSAQYTYLLRGNKTWVNPATLTVSSAAVATNAGNVTGTVAIANGGTGQTTRLAAIKALTNENVSTSATHFLGLVSDWSKVGYLSVANVKTVLGLGTAAYTASTAYAASTHTHSYLPLTGGTCTGNIAVSRTTCANTSMWIDNGGGTSTNTNTSTGKVGFIANTNGNHGVYDFTNTRWLIYTSNVMTTTTNFIPTTVATIQHIRIADNLKFYLTETGSVVKEVKLCDTRLTSGTKPSSGYSAKFSFNDKNGNSLGYLGYNCAATNGYGTLSLNVRNISGSAQTCVQLGYINTSGSTYAYCLAPTADNTINLGYATGRYKQLYAGTTTIATSDERVKSNISSIPENILDSWDKIEWKQFKFNDSIKEKGDNARLHIGLVAQDLDRVFKINNLNISNYGLFCHDIWDDKPEIKNENGEIISEGRIAGDLYAIRYEEALCMEAAWTRRELKQLKEENQQLKNRLNQLEEKLNQILTVP